MARIKLSNGKEVYRDKEGNTKKDKDLLKKLLKRVEELENKINKKQ